MLVSGGEEQLDPVAPSLPPEQENTIEAAAGVPAVEPPLETVPVPAVEPEKELTEEKNGEVVPPPVAELTQVPESVAIEEDVIVEPLDTPVVQETPPASNQEKPAIIIVRPEGKSGLLMRSLWSLPSPRLLPK